MQFNVDHTTVNMTSPKSTILCIFSYPAPPVYRAEKTVGWNLYHHTPLVCPNYTWNLAELARESLFYQNKGERRSNYNLLRTTSPLHPYILHSSKLPVDRILSTLILNSQPGILGERKTGIKGEKKNMILINYKLWSFYITGDSKCSPHKCCIKMLLVLPSSRKLVWLVTEIIGYQFLQQEPKHMSAAG